MVNAKVGWGKTEREEEKKGKMRIWKRKKVTASLREKPNPCSASLIISEGHTGLRGSCWPVNVGARRVIRVPITKPNEPTNWTNIHLVWAYKGLFTPNGAKRGDSCTWPSLYNELVANQCSPTSKTFIIKTTTSSEDSKLNNFEILENPNLKEQPLLLCRSTHRSGAVAARRLTSGTSGAHLRSCDRGLVVRAEPGASVCGVGLDWVEKPQSDGGTWRSSWCSSACSSQVTDHGVTRTLNCRSNIGRQFKVLVCLFFFLQPLPSLRSSWQICRHRYPFFVEPFTLLKLLPLFFFWGREKSDCLFFGPHCFIF